MGKLVIISCLFLVGAVGCMYSTPVPSAQPSTQQATTPLTIVDFRANPNEITTDGSSILLWDVTGATSVSIDQGIGNVPAAGTTSVSPPTTTIYTITASNADSSVTKSVTVTFLAATAPEPHTAPPEITDQYNSTPPQNLPSLPSTSDVDYRVSSYFYIVGSGQSGPGESCTITGTIKNNHSSYSMVDVTLPGISGPLEVATVIRPGEEVSFIKAVLCTGGSRLSWKWELLE